MTYWLNDRCVGNSSVRQPRNSLTSNHLSRVVAVSATKGWCPLSYARGWPRKLSYAKTFPLSLVASLPDTFTAHVGPTLQGPSPLPGLATIYVSKSEISPNNRTDLQAQKKKPGRRKPLSPGVEIVATENFTPECNAIIMTAAG